MSEQSNEQSNEQLVVSEPSNLLSAEELEQVKNFKNQADLLYGKIVMLTKKDGLTVENAIPVLVELMRQANTFKLRGEQKRLVVLTTIQKWCEEHAKDSKEFSLVVPMITVLVDVAKGYVSFDAVKKSCLPCC